MLLDAYKTCYGDCVGDRTILKLSLYISMFESTEMFEKLNEDLKEKLDIDIDRDVDYKHWAKTETWTSQKKKVPSSTTTLTYESLGMKKTSTFANNMAGMLPPAPETSTDSKEKKHQEGLTYTERDKFKDTINNLMNPSVLNDQVLDYAINATLQKLCTALLNISETIGGQHRKSTYAGLYSSQSFYYTNLMGKIVSENHKEWRNKYLDDQITEDSLAKHLEKELVELLKSGIFDEIETNVTHEQTKKHKEEIIFDENDFPKKKKPYDLYACFRTIYDFKKGKYTINEEKAGKLLFKTRKQANCREAFFRFNQILKHVYSDIQELREKDQVKSIIDDIDFSKLECRFTEEEVKASGIKNYAEGILPLMDKMQQGVPKTYWLAFYCVLLEKKMIEDNLNRFCNNMNKLFGVNLDYSALNKKKNEVEQNIEQWPESNINAEKKKNFGRNFSKYIDFYREYRLRLATKDLI